MSTFEIAATILIPLFSLGIAYFGVHWKRVRNTLVALGKAVEDDEITRAELKSIVEAILGREIEE